MAKKAPMLKLGHDYFLDNELTLKKHITTKEGKQREKVIGYYGNFNHALKRYADELMTAGITDGTLKTVNDAIIRYEKAVLEIKEVGNKIQKALKP